MFLMLEGNADRLAWMQRILVFLSSLLVVLPLVSCDKAKQALEKAQHKVKELRDKDKKPVELAVVNGVTTVSEAEGMPIIMSEKRLVMVEFYSDTWAPCRDIAPVLERLAEKNSDKVRIIKVDVNQDRSWASKENVRGIPAFRLYSGGMLIDQFTGAYPEKILQAKIEKYAETIKRTPQPKKKDKDGNVIDTTPKVPPVRPMPKDWLPPGVTNG